MTEDYLLTLRLKEIGFSTAYLDEPLTFGLAPEGLKEYITQRARWCLGFMQIARGRSGPLSTRSNLAWLDRLSLVEVFLELDRGQHHANRRADHPDRLAGVRHPPVPGVAP